MMEALNDLCVTARTSPLFVFSLALAAARATLAPSTPGSRAQRQVTMNPNGLDRLLVGGLIKTNNQSKPTG